jgi:LuxR family maltose regulon positive regulatory protein
MTTSRLGGVQDVPLLKTKLYIPPVRPERVPRPHLVSRLAAGLGQGPYGFARKLTLISAPAGFGKTTLLSECAAHCGPSISWLSLDERDNSPTRFWTYVIAALQTLYSGVGTIILEALQTPRALPNETLLGQLLNQIAEVPEPFVLILDDLHVITNPQLHETLIFFLENLPAPMHLVVSSRADPPWPLARWRARGQVVEIRTDDLRFTPAETAVFLTEAMGLDLSPEDVAALDARTEGWIAGLQLAALALQGSLSMQGRDASSFVRAFSGSHRFILDYLVEEVLDRQPAEIQVFLLQTSILERLTASLCDAVRFGFAKAPSSSSGTAVRFGEAEAPSSSRGEDSQVILEHLEQANLFLVPLDDERRWYRYHRLFADLLRSRLEQGHRKHVSTLHRRASAWCEKQGLISEAVGHALAAGDVGRVERMARRNALAMMDHGELRTMVRWLDALPEETMRSQPWLCIAQAWPLAYAGQGDAVEPLLQDAEQALTDRAEGDEGERRRIAGHLAAIRAYVEGGRGDLSKAAELAREALECLPGEDAMARGWAAYHLGFMLRMKGELEVAAQALEDATATGQAAGDSHVAVLALGELGVLRLQQGRLCEAAATHRSALALADDYARRSGRQLPATGYVLTRLSGVLREWNALEAAIQHARDGLELCKQWQQADALLEAYIHLARALQAAGDVDSARQALHGAMQVARDTSSWFITYTEAQAMRMGLAELSPDPEPTALFSRWVGKGGLSAEDELNFQYELMYRMLARILIEQGELDKGLGLLARLLSMVELAGAEGHAIEILVLQAVALETQGLEDQALVTLARALALGEPEGYVRTFVDEGAPMGRLLRRAVTQGVAVDYAGKLLAALEQESRRDATPLPVSEAALSPWIEPLSPRETEVLRLLTTPLSHAEIAEELVLSVNTVRSHIKSIYNKLDVHSRMEAVQRATELGLLN